MNCKQQAFHSVLLSRESKEKAHRHFNRSETQRQKVWKRTVRHICTSCIRSTTGALASAHAATKFFGSSWPFAKKSSAEPCIPHVSTAVATNNCRTLMVWMMHPTQLHLCLPLHRSVYLELAAEDSSWQWLCNLFKI